VRVDGDEVQRVRVGLELSQEELARMADLSKGYISQVETNKSDHISAAAARQIAAALGISLESLVKAEPSAAGDRRLTYYAGDASMPEQILTLCEQWSNRLTKLEARLDALEDKRARRKRHGDAATESIRKRTAAKRAS
jgi:transcriptional regulator with XRE-family HTH domain